MFKRSQLESVQAWIAHPANSALPLHTRIQRAIRQLIMDGALGRGAALPSTRALAKHLQVSRDTIETAYTQLHSEGFIERKVGSGSYVAEVTKFEAGQSRKNRADQKKSNNKTQLSKRGAAVFAAGGVFDTQDLKPFAHGMPETRNFPLSSWERLERQILKEYGSKALLPCDPQGAEPLRKVIANYINLERGARATAEQILILTSSQYGITLAATTLFDPGDRLFIEDPAYHGARKAFEAAGLQAVPIPVDNNGIQVNKILSSNSGAKAVFITPSHQFPTGAKLSLERRLSLIDWAAKNDAWLLEDDYDSEFHYSGKPTACMQGLDPNGRTIYIGTFTKSLFPSLRIGYLVLPPQLVKPMTIARTVIDGYTPLISQLTLSRFIESGHFGAHVRMMRSIYAERQNTLASLIHKHLSNYMKPQVPIGGLQLPCTLTCELTESEVITAAKLQGIDLFALSPLYSKESYEKGLLLGFSAHTPSEMETSVKALSKILRSLSEKLK